MWRGNLLLGRPFSSQNKRNQLNWFPPLGLFAVYIHMNIGIPSTYPPTSAASNTSIFFIFFSVSDSKLYLYILAAKKTGRLHRMTPKTMLCGEPDHTVRYHSGGSMELNACILLLAHMVYL